MHSRESIPVCVFKFVAIGEKILNISYILDKSM